MFNLKKLTENREAAANATLPQQERKWYFPTIPVNRLDPGKYRMRMLPPHPEKNPDGLFILSTYAIRNNSTDANAKFECLHPSCYADPNGADAYWGLNDLMVSIKTQQTQDGVPILEAYSSDEEQMKVFKNFDPWERYQVPILVQAVSTGPKIRRDGTAGNAKYPNYGPNPNPAGKWIDMVLEVNLKSKEGDGLYQMISENLNMCSYENGADFEFTKTAVGVGFTYTYKVLPARAISAEHQKFATDNYPDLLGEAKRRFHKPPAVIRDAVLKSWFWGDAEDETGLAGMGFELAKVKAKPSGIKIAGKAKPKAEDTVDVLNEALQQSDPYPSGVEEGDLPF